MKSKGKPSKAGSKWEQINALLTQAVEHEARADWLKAKEIFKKKASKLSSKLS